MEERYWTDQLDGIFSHVENVRGDVESRLKNVFAQKGLIWDSNVTKSLSGDIHTRVLGAYLERYLSKKAIESDLQYEFILRPTRLRADILINGIITVESKAQGIFSLETLKKRWDRLNNEFPKLVHILVSWHHNPAVIRQIRQFIPETRHYYFHDLLTHENKPLELERLVRNIESWVRKTDSSVTENKQQWQK